MNVNLGINLKCKKINKSYVKARYIHHYHHHHSPNPKQLIEREQEAKGVEGSGEQFRNYN